jgi:hypothetical protein
MGERIVKLQSIERADARCFATCEVPEKYVAALLASGEWERVTEPTPPAPPREVSSE